MKKIFRSFYLWVSIVFVLFQVVTPLIGAIPGVGQRAIHLAFIIFLLYCPSVMEEGHSIHKRLLDGLLMVGGISASLYLIAVDDMLLLRAGKIWTSDVVFGTIMIIVLIDATRRIVGTPLAIVALCFIGYAFVGPWMPGLFQHAGIPYSRLAYFTYMTSDGILGTPLYAAATYIVLFVVLGAIFQETGIGDFFTKIAASMFGGMRGGPAKIAVVASGFFGSISGSAMANVIGTGTFTIPLMKKSGIEDNYAAAVEAAASTGGQIMPPIMGATAFIVAEIVGIPYIQLVKAAILPAVLYFVAILFTVDLYARRKDIKGIDPDQIPKFRDLSKKMYLLLPIVVLVLLMSVFRFTIMKTGIYTILFSILLVLPSKETRIDKERFVRIVKSSVSGTIPVSIACSVVGIIISVLTLTNLGFRISRILIEASGGHLPILLVLTMLVSLVLGMGMPTTASYLVLAVLVAPTMIKMGVPALAAHLFIFYFGIISNITPPVALAAYTAAGVANSNPNKTGFIAFKLAISGFILPFMFVYNPILLWQGTWYHIIWATVTSLIGVYCLSGSLEGYWLQWPVGAIERIFLGGIALLLIDPNGVTDILGLGIIALLYIYIKFFRERIRKTEL